MAAVAMQVIKKKKKKKEKRKTDLLYMGANGDRPRGQVFSFDLSQKSGPGYARLASFGLKCTGSKTLFLALATQGIFGPFLQ